MITEDQLLAIARVGRERMAIFVDPLNAAMHEARINTGLRQAAFLAQVMHESGRLMYMKELASGIKYEGRVSLGNTQPGDGVKYKGRGPIQITGRANYTAIMMDLGIDCVEHPELLEQPAEGCRASAWFWSTRQLNALADAGDFEQITKKINGGLNGQPDRLALYSVAKKVLGV